MLLVLEEQSLVYRNDNMKRMRKMTERDTLEEQLWSESAGLRVDTRKDVKRSNHHSVVSWTIDSNSGYRGFPYITFNIAIFKPQHCVRSGGRDDELKWTRSRS